MRRPSPWSEKGGTKSQLLIGDRPITFSLPEVLNCNSVKLALWLLTTVLKRTVHVELVLDGGDRKRSHKAMKTKVLEEHMVARSH